MKTATNIEQTVNQETMNEAIIQQLKREQYLDELRYSIGHVSEKNESQGNAQSNQFEQFFEEQGLIEKVDRQKTFEENFDILTKNIILDLQDELVNSWRETRPIEWEVDDSNAQSWNELRKWDTMVQCNGVGCNAMVSKSPVSNDRKLWQTTKSLLSEYDSEIANSVFIFKKPSTGGNFDQSVLRLRLSQDYPFVNYTKSNENLEENFEKFTHDELEAMRKADLSVYRLMLHANLCLSDDDKCPNCGSDLWAYTPNASDENVYFNKLARVTVNTIVSTILGSEMFLSSKVFRGTLESFELPAQIKTIPESVVNLFNDIDKQGAELKRLNKAKQNEQPFDVELLQTVRKSMSELKTQFFKDLFTGLHDDYLVEISKIAPSTYNRSLIKQINLRIEGECQLRSGSINQYDFAKMRHSGVLSSAIHQSMRYNANLTLANIDGQTIDLDMRKNGRGRDERATSLKLIDNISNELIRFKPLAFFADGVTEFPKINQLRWAKRAAGQLLMAASRVDGFIKLSKINPNQVNNSKKVFEHKLWTVRFRKAFKNTLSNIFDDLDSVNHYFNIERFDPMTCPPENRTKDLNKGGYLTEHAQKRAPLISNNSVQNNFGIRRFEPSVEAIDSINQLQKTPWKVNFRVARAIINLLKLRVEQFEQSLKIRFTQSGPVIDYLNPEGDFLEYDGGQLEEWMENLDLALSKSLDDDKSSVFWHSWQFDWRGRMYPSSNLLSPQGDDVSRGMLLFGKGLPLTPDVGLKYLSRAIGRAYAGRPLYGSNFTDQDFKIWSEIQELLKTKSWEDIDSVFNDVGKLELLIKVFSMVRDDPEGTFEIWGAGDVFGKKREGFQRLNLTIGYADCIDEINSGNLTPVVSVPYVVDASSNIYQHSAVLIADANMARSVNVISNADGVPSDVYQEVANKVKSIIQHKKPFSAGFDGLTKENIKQIEDFCALRNTAKLPVMTIGYGAKDRSIILQLLSHNGEDSGIIKVAYYRQDDGSIVSSDDYYELKEKSESDPDSEFSDQFSTTRSAHPVSKLGKLLSGSKISESLHYDIAKTIVKLYREAIDEVLSGHSDVRNTLELIKKSIDKHISSDLFVTWKTQDGSTVNNIVLNNNDPMPIEPWNSNHAFGTHANDDDDDDIQEKSVTFTSKVPTPQRRKRKESSGIAPNFIHSIDANHMRLFTRTITQKSDCHNIWSVHDAFGTHPNFGDQVINVGVETFFQSHEQQNSTSMLHKLIRSTIEALNQVNNKSKKRKEIIEQLTEKSNQLDKLKSNVTIERLDEEQNRDRIYLIS